MIGLFSLGAIEQKAESGLGEESAFDRFVKGKLVDDRCQFLGFCYEGTPRIESHFVLPRVQIDFPEERLAVIQTVHPWRRG